MINPIEIPKILNENTYGENYTYARLIPGRKFLIIIKDCFIATEISLNKNVIHVHCIVSPSACFHEKRKRLRGRMHQKSAALFAER